NPKRGPDSSWPAWTPISSRRNAGTHWRLVDPSIARYYRTHGRSSKGDASAAPWHARVLRTGAAAHRGALWLRPDPRARRPGHERGHHLPAPGHTAARRI